MTIRKTPTNSNVQSAILAGLTARTIFPSASNTTGIKIHSGSALSIGPGACQFVIATTAPAALTDGLIVSTIQTANPATNDFFTFKITEDTFVPAGYGLYFISGGTSIVTNTMVSSSVA